MTRIPFLLFVMMFLQSTITFSQQHNIAEIPRINALVAYKKFMKGDILIVDAMNERTYAKYHIVGAISLPGDGVDDLARIEAADLQIPFNKEILVYCD